MSDQPSTAGQTVGPFFGYALPYDGDSRLVGDGEPDRIRLHGVVLDGAGDPVPDALVELWQPGPDGAVVQQPGSLRRDGFTFTGWGRCPTDPAGQYSFTTLAPGGPAPFFGLTVFARGMTNRLFTRAYLPLEDPERVPLLARLPAERRSTLLATADPHGYRFDVRLQGENETVFLRYPRH